MRNEKHPEESLNLLVNNQRLSAELSALALISEAQPPVVTRIVFSEADQRARSYIKSLCSQAGLTIREDAIGNIFFRWEGSETGLPPVATGSHIDAIPNAGAYDGTVGVLGGLEAIRTLQQAGYRPRRSIELILFTSEEPTRFGIGCLGSRMISGTLTAGQAIALTDKDGKPFDQLRINAGFSGDLGSVVLAQGHFHAFVELHIEQGTILEREKLDIGVVTHIAAPASLRVIVEGEGGHAGAILMPNRHDALTAAAELILVIENAAVGSGAVDTVATVGVCEVFPGAVNSVPSRVRLETDIRDTEGNRRDLVIANIRSAAVEIETRRGVRVNFEPVNADPPASSDPETLRAVEEALAQAGLHGRRMVSRAYHDSLFMARIAPVTMIFIPCRAGVSHRPDEFASPEWIAGGVEVLARTLAILAL